MNNSISSISSSNSSVATNSGSKLNNSSFIFNDVDDINNNSLREIVNITPKVIESVDILANSNSVDIVNSSSSGSGNSNSNGGGNILEESDNDHQATLIHSDDSSSSESDQDEEYDDDEDDYDDGRIKVDEREAVQLKQDRENEMEMSHDKLETDINIIQDNKSTTSIPLMDNISVGHDEDGSTITNVNSSIGGASPSNNPFSFENVKSRELYTSKIMEKQKSLDNIPMFYSEKLLKDKRHIFITKLVNKVFSTLKSATSDDLLASQRNRILKELFRNISSELDDSVLEFLQCDEFKQSSPSKESSSSSISKQSFASFSPLQIAQQNNTNNDNNQIKSIPPLNLDQDQTFLFDDPLYIDIEKKPYNYSYPILDDKDQHVIYYYQLIAEYLCQIPNQVDKYRHLFISLWNNHWFLLIFSCLFHKWLLEYRLSLIPQVNVFIKATNRLFWHDTDHLTQRFTCIYLEIKNLLLDHTQLWKGLNEAYDFKNENNKSILRRNRRIWIDFYHIITVFMFYYEEDDKTCKESMDIFRNQINQQYTTLIYPNGGEDEDPQLAQLSIDDIFVRGIIRHLYLIKHEDVLIKYIEKCVLFKDWNLNAVTKIKLQSCLYSFSKPGSPFHMPRGVRVASRSSLNELFPEGMVSRYMVNLFFRLLHPYYSTGSIVHWIAASFDSLRNHLSSTVSYYTPNWMKRKRINQSQQH